MFIFKYEKVLKQLENCTSKLFVGRKKNHEEKELVLTSHSLHYLTNRRLLAPQLESSRDLPLHILTQFSITQAFLSTESPSLASMLEPLAKRTNLLMEKLAPKHAHLLTTLLEEREVLWRSWKKKKCKPALRVEVSTKGEADDSKNNKTRSLVSLASMLKDKHDDDDLSFLQPPSNLCQVSRDIVSVVPSIEKHLTSYVEALDPEAGIDEGYGPKQDKLMTWQALRLLSHQHLPLFSQIQTNGDFENVVRKVYEQKGEKIPGEYLKEETYTDENDDKKDEEATKLSTIIKEDIDSTNNKNGDDQMDVESRKQNEDSDIKVEDELESKVKEESSVLKDERPKVGNEKEVEKECVAQKVGIVNTKHDTKASIKKPSNDEEEGEEPDQCKEKFPIKQENFPLKQENFPVKQENWQPENNEDLQEKVDGGDRKRGRAFRAEEKFPKRTRQDSFDNVHQAARGKELGGRGGGRGHGTESVRRGGRGIRTRGRGQSRSQSRSRSPSPFRGKERNEPGGRGRGLHTDGGGRHTDGGGRGGRMGRATRERGRGGRGGRDRENWDDNRTERNFPVRQPQNRNPRDTGRRFPNRRP